MNGYKIGLRRDVYQNGEYSHCVTRDVTTHAHDEGTAVRMAQTQLEPGSTQTIGDTIYRVENEWVYKVDLLGVAYLETVIKYKKGE